MADNGRAAASGSRQCMEHALDAVSSILSQVLPLPQEAALLYANARVQEAAQRLERAIAPGGGYERDPEAWSMLLDLHRAEADWPAFEQAATRFEAAFGRAAPAWLAPEDVAHLPVEMQAAGTAHFEVVGPLDAQGAARLGAMHSRAARHSVLHLDLSKATDIDAEGCRALSETLRFLFANGTGVLVTGMERVEYLLRAAVEGDGGARPYWSLLLDLYQLRGMQAEFERAALEYALGTGEQPPQWSPMVRPVIAPPAVEERREEPRYETAPEVVHLRGVMSGAADSQLRELDRFAQGRRYVNIHLARLARMDLACATEFAARVNELARAGKTVRLLRPSGLIGALLASFELAPGVTVIKRAAS